MILGGLAALVAAVVAVAAPVAAVAADRAQLRDFLEVTGFDVAITSMQQGAMAGPGLAGDAPDAFGQQWVRLAEQVFDPDLMLDRALDMMAAVMPDALVEHGMDFYASDLGVRLVAAENASHVTPDAERYAIGEDLVAAMIEDNPGRVEDLRAMTNAIGGVDASVRAVIEIQLRYLMAAAAAQSGEANFSESELRALLAEQAPRVRENIEVYSLIGSAYVYRDFSDDDVAAYLAALEHPMMQQVYEVLNAVQYEVMAERYEALAARLTELTPQQDI
jgi:hypothetical protein